MDSPEREYPLRHATGGSGAFNQFGGQLSLEHLTITNSCVSCGYATEINLDSLKEMFKTNYNYRCQMNINLTSKMKEALDHLRKSNAVVIYGRPGEGKTVCAFRLVKSLIDENEIRLNKCILLPDPEKLKYVRISQVDLILIDDIFGKHSADPCKLSAWRNYFDTLESFVVNRTVKIIIVSRMHILLEYRSELYCCKVFTSRVLLNSADLSQNEKKDILTSHLSSFNKTLDHSSKEACISQQETDVGFPLCCQLFASDEECYLKGSEFFKRCSKTFLENNLRVLKIDSLLALLYVFYKGNLLSTKDLNITNISCDSEAILTHLARLYGVTKPTGKEIKQNIECLKGSFLNDINGCISFVHETMYETVALLVLEKDPAQMIQNCTLDFLCQCVRLVNGEEGGEIVIENDHFDSLAKRCIDEVVTKRNGKGLSKHPMLIHHEFLEELFAQLTIGDERLRDFFSAGLSSKRMGVHAFLYHVLVDGRGIEFLRQALPHLRCDHDALFDELCWKCQVKAEALAAVCRSNQTETYKEMREDGVQITELCLNEAIENQAVDIELVNMIVEDLKLTDPFILSSKDLQLSLGLSLKNRDKRIFDTLKQHGMKATIHFLYYAVQTGNVSLLSSTIQELQYSKIWKADSYYVSRAIVEARVTNRKEMHDMLKSYGAKINEGAVYWAIADHDLKEVKYVVQELKERHVFDGEAKDIAWSLALTMKQNNKKIHDFLRKEGAVATTTLVLAMTEFGQPPGQITAVIKELREHGRWNAEDRFIAGAYVIASSRANKSIEEILEREGCKMCSGCLNYVVLHFPKNMENILNQLKTLGQFDPLDKHIARTLVWSTEYKDSISNKLREAGLSFNMASLVSAVEPIFALSTLETVIHHVKTNNDWEPKSDFALEALNVAYKRQDKTAYEKLLSEGIEWAPRNLYLATQYETLYGLQQVINVLSEKNMLDPSCPEIQKAIALARSYKSRDKYKEITKVCPVSR